MKRIEGLFWERNERKVEEGVYALIVRYAATQHQPPGSIPLLFERHFQSRIECYSSLTQEPVFPDFLAPINLDHQEFCSGENHPHDSRLQKLEEFASGLSAPTDKGAALFAFLQFYLALGTRITQATQQASFSVPSSCWSQTFWSSLVAPSFVVGVGALETIVDELLPSWEGGNEGAMVPNKIQQAMGSVLELEVDFLRGFDSLLPPIALVPTSHTLIELVIDFDGTITSEETSHLLPLLSLQKKGKSKEEAEDEWRNLGKNYMATYTKFLSTSLPSPSTPSSSTIFEFLAQYDDFENGAYNPVEDSLCLSHISMEDIKACALALHHKDNDPSSPPPPQHEPPIPTPPSIRPGCKAGLRKMTQESTSLSVISLNWSQEFVSEVVSLSFPPSSPLPPHCRVLSNGLFSTPPPHASFLSTGKLTRRVTTSKEKVVFSSHPNSLKITIGDSLNDLSALLSSDVGIILKNHQTKQLSGSLSRVCKAYDVSLLPLFACTFPSLSSPSSSPSSRGKHIIFVAEGWWELCAWWEEWKGSCQKP